jgi:hypothetical protein
VGTAEHILGTAAPDYCVSKYMILERELVKMMIILYLVMDFSSYNCRKENLI